MLDYIWIEDYRVIKKQGFNFNPNFYYSFNPENNTFSCEKRAVLPDDFFQINNDTVKIISALVGANGTGKSTVLEFISAFLNQPSKLPGFILLNNQIINKTDREINIEANWGNNKPSIINKLDLQNNYKVQEGMPPLSSSKEGNVSYQGFRVLGNVIKDVREVYYSGELNLAYTNRVYQSLLDLSSEFESSHYSDLSDIAMLSLDQNRFRSDKAIYSGENPILTYRAGESERLLNILLSDFNSFIPFQINNYWLSITLSDIDSMFFESYDEIAFVGFAQVFQYLNQNKFENIAPGIVEEIINYGFGGYFEHRLSEAERKEEAEIFELKFFHHLLMRHLREQVMECLGELPERDKLKYIIDLFKEVEKYFFNDNPYLYQTKQYLSSTIFLKINVGGLQLEAAEKLFKELSNIDLWNENKIIFELNDTLKVNQFKSAINEFVESYGSRYPASNIFEFELKGLSTGEKQFLKLFSRFLSFDINNSNEYFSNSTIILLIDEFDMGFHPLWQRKYLKTLIEFLEKFINTENSNKIKLQLIITSHSPFVVSDLPKECINFLYKPNHNACSQVEDPDKHSATLGANIHELYSDSFFLDKAQMGDFAKQKIDDAFKELTVDNPDYTKVEKIIRVVGEPILKIKLAELLAKKRGDDVELARLIAQQEYINERLSQIKEKEKNAKDK